MKKGNYAMKGDGPLNCNFIESKYIQLEGTNYTDVYLREDYLK